MSHFLICACCVLSLCCSLIVTSQVAHDVQMRMNQSPDFARHLASMRQQLMGMADNIRR